MNPAIREALTVADAVVAKSHKWSGHLSDLEVCGYCKDIRAAIRNLARVLIEEAAGLPIGIKGEKTESPEYRDGFGEAVGIYAAALVNLIADEPQP